MCKKLLALAAVALVGVCAQAKEVVDMEVDWTSTSWNRYVMGYIPQTSAEEGLIFEWPNFNYVKVEDDGANPNGYAVVSINGEDHYVVPTEDGGPMESWGIQAHMIPTEVATEVGTAYSITIVGKSNKEGATLGMPFSWGWSNATVDGSVVFEGTGEWEELTCDYAEVGGSSCWLVGQMYDNEARICIKSVKITHNASDEEQVVEWEDWIINGDAEGEYGEYPCAYSKTYQGRAADNSEIAKPVPATIIEEADGNHVFISPTAIVNPDDCPDEFYEKQEDGSFKVDDNGNKVVGGAPEWQNQFWIQSPKEWKGKDMIRVSFRYKADKPATANTQAHRETPGDYLMWYLLGDINFTTEWQQYSKEITLDDGQNGMWSAAFNLKEYTIENNYYFDDIKWESMKLDEGWFIAGDFNDWNLGQAIEMIFSEDDYYEAIIGTEETPASQFMISTKRGNDNAYKSNSIKPATDLVIDDFVDFTSGVFNTKVNLPEEGIWKVLIDPELNQISIEEADGSDVIVPGDDDPGDDNPDSVVDNMAETAAPVYYNLQGIQVNNPTEGNVYIVKTGKKVSKRIIR